MQLAGLSGVAALTGCRESGGGGESARTIKLGYVTPQDRLAVIGGLGSLWGALLGGLVLGVAQTLGAQLSPGWGVLAGHLVFLAVLAFRPTGLLGRAVPA